MSFVSDYIRLGGRHFGGCRRICREESLVVEEKVEAQQNFWIELWVLSEMAGGSARLSAFVLLRFGGSFDEQLIY